MKIRNSIERDDKAKLNLTSAVDIVFLLLIFFLLTFRITANEGDFNVMMPRNGGGGIVDSFELPIQIRITANPDGSVSEIYYDGRLIGNEFSRLKKLILREAGAPGPEREKRVRERRIVFDCERDLNYKEVIAAVTAVSGRRLKNGEIEKLFERIEFKDRVTDSSKPRNEK